MAILAALLTAAALLTVGELSHAAPSNAEEFWRSNLPGSPLPEAILRLLHPAETKANGSGKCSSSTGGDDVDALVRKAPVYYSYAQGKRSSHHPTMAMAGADNNAAGDDVGHNMTVFFHEKAMRVGNRMPFYFPPALSIRLGLLPRRVAESIPFSSSALPGIRARFGIPGDSTLAANMEETLDMCEMPAIAGEVKFCATSLEALVEGAMAALGTRDVRPLTSELPQSVSPPLQPYTIRAVRPVDGAGFLSCHDQDYPYTVYVCHDIGSTRAYMMQMEGDSGNVVTVATICHADTSNWNPEHVSFRFLGGKPGGPPICHFLPYGNIVWVSKANRSSA